MSWFREEIESVFLDAQWSNCFHSATVTDSVVNIYIYIYFFKKCVTFIEVTLVNKVIEVSTVQFYNTASVYGIACLVLLG